LDFSRQREHGESVMTEFSKATWFSAPGVTQRTFVLTCALALSAAGLAFVPILPTPALWELVHTAPAAQPQVAEADSNWAGHLENPGPGGVVDRTSTGSLTSESYTTGFDSSNALPLPRTRVKLVTSNPDACPKGLNCTFRPKTPPVAILPPPRPLMMPQTPPPPVVVAQHHAPKHKAGLLAFMPRFPTTRQLVKPFATMANDVGGFFRKL
jgi:hypothetical protein